MLFLLLSCAVPATTLSAAPSSTTPEATGIDAVPAPAPPDEAPPAIVAAARRHLGRPYTFGGRGATLDCMGLVFLAWSETTGISWRRLSVNPTEIVAKRQLGETVLAGIAASAIDWSVLAPGDVVFLLAPAENPAEPAIATVAGVPHWVWHMGLYSGGASRAFIVGDHYAGRVTEEPLPAYLRVHADTYDAILVTRP